MTGRVRPPALSEGLEFINDEELARMRSEAEEVLKALASREDVAREYQARFLPLEREAVWREGREREPFDLLFITVGAQADTPIAVGLGWPAHYVYFVHTDTHVSIQAAEKAAVALGIGMKGGDLLPVGSGMDADLIYGRIFERFQLRGRPSRVGVDPTGGYKSMTAAASAVAFAIPGAETTYVETDQPRLPNGGQCWLRTRTIGLSNPYRVFGELERPAARELLRKGSWEAAAQAWRDLAQKTRMPQDEWRARFSDAMGHRAALDLKGASQRLGALLLDIGTGANRQASLASDPLVTGLAKLRDHQVALQRLADLLPVRGDPVATKKVVVDEAFPGFIAFVLQLGSEHLEAGRFDLAALFAYRALEAIPARRLGLLGVDVEAEDLDCTGAWTRLNVGFDDIRVGMNKIIGLSEARNKNILAHGCQSVAEKDARSIHSTALELFRELCMREGLDSARLLADQDALSLSKEVA